MPLSALPDHLNSREEIEAAFPDDSQYGDNWFGRFYRWLNKATKTWFAFSYRCTEWWARWRKYPKVLFAVGGKGLWRYEYQNGVLLFDKIRTVFNGGYTPYLSRVQYYKRWHFSIQWPLLISFHFYPKASDVPKPTESLLNTDGKLWFFYWNHFDADLVYWMVTSMFLGTRWK